MLGAWAGAELATGTLPSVRGERPHLALAVTLEQVRAGGIGQLDIPDTSRTIDLPAASVTRLGCDAHAAVVLVGNHAYDEHGRLLEPEVTALMTHGWEVLAYGRRRRTVGRGLRAALVRRDQGCAFPGCRAPAHWTDAHHVIPWTHGGRTDIANLVLLCERHHHYVHEGRWTITARPGSHPGRPGHWQFHPPTPRPRP